MFLLGAVAFSRCTAKVGPYVKDIQLDDDGRVTQYERCVTIVMQMGNLITVDNQAQCERVQVKSPPPTAASIPQT
jgi:hypothetical protein